MTVAAALHGFVRTVATTEQEPTTVTAAGLKRFRWFAYLGPAAVLLAVGFAFAAMNDLHELNERPRAIVAAVLALPLALVSWSSLWAWRISWLGAMIVPLYVRSDHETVWPWTSVQVIIALVVLYVVARRHDRVIVIWVWVLTQVPIWWHVTSNNRPGVSIAVTVILLLGDQIRARALSQRRLAREQEQLRAEQDRRAALSERTQIAREMHDVVAHHMSLIAVRAESAPYRIADLNAAAQAEFAEISGSARDSLTEMRRLLGVLRSEEGAEKRPQPGIGELPELVTAARAAGATITSHFTVASHEVSELVGIQLYRIAQEALANAARHAPGAAVAVALTVTDGTVRLEIVNGPSEVATPDESITQGGHGIQGMRERVSLMGGQLTAGRKPNGGFAVVITVPETEASA